MPGEPGLATTGTSPATRAFQNPSNLFGFALASVFAVAGGWTLPEFCWSVWLAGLLFASSRTVSGAIEIVVTARSRRAAYHRQLALVGKMPTVVYAVALVLLVGALALVVLYAYGFLFALYGLLLSFFAEMEPLELFGRNGFINADFSTSVRYLAVAFWPMVVGTWVANWTALFEGDPWKRLLVPAAATVLRTHALVVLMPFLALIAWALVGEAYHSVTIVVLMGVFYLIPGTEPSPQPSDPKTTELRA